MYLVALFDNLCLMDIKYLGHSCFYISTKNANIVIDPYSEKMTGFSMPKVEADIVLVSHKHEDHNAVSSVSGSPFVISGAGEYEVREVKVDGLETYHDSKKGAERGRNTLYQIRVEGLSIVHCGDLGHLLSDSQVEYMGVVNILMVPVGGVYTIGAEEAGKLIAQLEPNIVIPMHYKTGKHGKDFSDVAPLEEFLKTIGGEPRTEKVLKIKRETLPEEQQVVVLG